MLSLILVALGLSILAVISMEIHLSRNRKAILFSPSFARGLYIAGLLLWIPALLATVLPKEPSWIPVGILIAFLFLCLFFAALLVFSSYSIQKDKLIKKTFFLKKTFPYSSFYLSFDLGRVVGTSRKNGKQLFALTSFQTNVEDFVQTYFKNTGEKNDMRLAGIVRSNQAMAITGIVFLIMGLCFGILAGVLGIPNLLPREVPIGFLAFLWFMTSLVVLFSIIAFLIYFFYYLVLKKEEIEIHKPFRFPKTFKMEDLVIDDNYAVIKLKNTEGKLIFFILRAFSTNSLVLYHYLKRSEK